MQALSQQHGPYDDCSKEPFVALLCLVRFLCRFLLKNSHLDEPKARRQFLLGRVKPLRHWDGAWFRFPHPLLVLCAVDALDLHQRNPTAA